MHVYFTASVPGCPRPSIALPVQNCSLNRYSFFLLLQFAQYQAAKTAHAQSSMGNNFAITVRLATEEDILVIRSTAGVRSVLRAVPHVERSMALSHAQIVKNPISCRMMSVWVMTVWLFVCLSRRCICHNCPN